MRYYETFDEYFALNYWVNCQQMSDYLRIIVGHVNLEYKFDNNSSYLSTLRHREVFFAF